MFSTALGGSGEPVLKSSSYRRNRKFLVHKPHAHFLFRGFKGKSPLRRGCLKTSLCSVCLYNAACCGDRQGDLAVTC